VIVTLRRARIARALAVTTLAALPLVALTGCSTQKTVSASELGTKAQAALADATGGEVPPVSCPSDLEAKAGNTTTCTITDDTGAVYDVTVTITSVDEATDNVKFDVQVADQPN
jgi:hypothetical protein